MLILSLAYLALAAASHPIAASPAAPQPLRPNQPATDPRANHTIPQDMKPIMALLVNHSKIHYRVEMIRHGARTLTTSTDPALVRVIQIHAWEMKARLDHGVNIRPYDPLFTEIFKHHSEIHVRLRNVRDGALEDDTSANPQVVLLIRAHAKRVAEFVREGSAAARRPGSLPPGYRATAP
jgi:hypothetical protein